MADQSFGQFKSVGEFLDHHKIEQARAATAAERDLPFEAKVTQRRQQTPNLVEVTATLKRREADDTSGAQHVQIFITLTKVVSSAPSVTADVDRVLAAGEDVFVAIRIGDPSGITQPIEGLVEGVGLDVKGEWIPKDQARAEGGQAVSVLHFTHHPVGFICVDQPAACYQ